MAPGKMPVTSAVKLTAPKVGAPPALPCNTVLVVPSDDATVGAVPAPPPSTMRFAVSAAEDEIAALDEK